MLKTNLSALRHWELNATKSDVIKNETLTFYSPTNHVLIFLQLVILFRVVGDLEQIPAVHQAQAG